MYLLVKNACEPLTKNAPRDATTGSIHLSSIHDFSDRNQSSVAGFTAWVAATC